MTIQLTRDELVCLIGHEDLTWKGLVPKVDSAEIATAATRGLAVLSVRELVSLGDGGKVTLSDKLADVLSVLNAPGDSYLVRIQIDDADDGDSMVAFALKECATRESVTMLPTPLGTMVFAIVDAEKGREALEAMLEGVRKGQVESGASAHLVHIPANGETVTTAV